MDNIDDLIGIICIAGEPYGEPKGSVSITQNGSYNIKPFATANVNVPQGITPSGTLSIVDNGIYNVTNYAEANVSVPQGVFPSGVLSIDENKFYDITNYSGVSVNVPQGVFPSGTLNITENDTYDVTNYEGVNVNVPDSYSETLLWTNPSLSTNFNEQSIGVDVSQYDYVKIIYTAVSGAGELNYQETIFPVSKLDNATYDYVFGVDDNTRKLSRSVDNSLDLHFSSCIGSSTFSTVVNSACKPVRIYGVNF